MNPTTLQGYVRAQPFRPFRVTMNSGKFYDIRHPEMVHVGKDFFNYYTSSGSDQFPDSWETVSLLLVENVQHLDQVVNAATGLPKPKGE
ncbi:MAG TPA: hypothetical protein VE988_27355 [Gemmataceae bacterium]|nr:hypothetical protein [Gemmataceae bacterium]